MNWWVIESRKDDHNALELYKLLNCILFRMKDKDSKAIRAMVTFKTLELQVPNTQT